MADAGVMRWVDKIRPDFEGLDRKTTLGECRHQGAGKGCFAAPAMRAGYEYSGNHAVLFRLSGAMGINIRKGVWEM